MSSRTLDRVLLPDGSLGRCACAYAHNLLVNTDLGELRTEDIVQLRACAVALALPAAAASKGDPDASDAMTAGLATSRSL